MTDPKPSVPNDREATAAQGATSESAQGCPFGHGASAGGDTNAHSTAPDEATGWHDAQLDFSQSMSYGDYLSLGSILSAQKPLSPDHNEMLFIIQHQTSELWMKLALYELRAALGAVHRDELPPAFKMLARISRILEQLVQAWSVIATMTPSEYTAMRPYLGASSGFQSYQYRQIEFLLGNKNEHMLKPHAHQPAVLAEVRATLEAPSLYDEVVFLLARKGFAIAPARLARDWTQPTVHDESVEAAWLEVYRNPSQHWELYEMAEELVDLEDAFRQWRFRHVTTVERIIGFKQGTGGTSGAPYLRKMLDVVLFPELWHVRTVL
ncbi:MULTISPECIES: tryptophan 2,3-dioxygenase [Paraburkholderia]|uniref:tryptophan 2,3-dioxygenase n=1 Tax=Paraburkholderia TaxID=1822464 RepID=UPI00225AB469|nr:MULTISPECIES: tryptophan 2,3-dioxygenase [Paraburkholderia]MCX4161169.1 tryptophan 2,3-dioxygenase [Paraburkholderia megapolitana]MDN7156665.1 tryptophan 2,3-dioxygenase [Paraburkholderia sp. CHISQ3]MDQ6493710.1 tryptophan 2,3-dioxygenase [Paraburkholderia megapolitana]